MSPRALITGISGQDGSYLAELLLEEGYDVYGVVRRPVGERFRNIDHLRDQLKLIAADVRDADALGGALAISRPHEIYHLASPSFVPDLWARPSEALEAIARPTSQLLELVRDGHRSARVMVASSREIFGDSGETPQRETSPLRPTTPYGVAKLAGFLLARILREHSDLYVCSAILYNHESPRRPERFVSRKVTRGAAAIKLGLQDRLVLGSLEAVRDWSFAGDAMRAARLMLGHEVPDDYVIASGQGRTVGDMVKCAFGCVDLDPDQYLEVDEQLVRSSEATPQIGDPSKAQKVLGWQARVSFEDLIASMVQADLRELAAAVS
jgi:GDPmannose 4,6-dehydratase